jgi:CRISPR-associated protein Csb2
MLALEIEFLTGSVFAAKSEDDPITGWPPQPDRIFSALVASWGARGEKRIERDALEWLEKQPAPRLIAQAISERSAPIVFVPPNDFKTSTSGAFDVIPSRRRRQARRFPGGHLTDPILRIVWDANPAIEIRNSLDAIARDTAYLGHSMSLTRCRFVDDDFDLSQSRSASRITYAGRLRELEHAFRSGDRPNPGFTVALPPSDEAYQTVQSVFSDRWIILADDGGHVPDIRSAAMIMRKVRDAVMGAYDRVHGSSPEWLSGHAPDGSRSLSPHVAVVPLADIGWKHSDGRFMGCAIVLPRSVPSDALNSAIGRLMEIRDDDGDANIELHYGGAKPWYLRPTEMPERASLKSKRWTGPARIWATATPIIIDRYPKGRDAEAREAEIVNSISRACQNIGLPAPSQVILDLASRINGAPAAAIGRTQPAWQRWRLPDSLAGRYLTHATLGFDEFISGPVLLGAGRYAGLGMCMPIIPRSK